jgi:hypothetical protein
MSAEAVVALLADDLRLRVFSAVVLGGSSPGHIQAMTGLAEGDVLVALRRLVEGGLVAPVNGLLIAQLGLLQQLAGRPGATPSAPPAPQPAQRHPDRFREAVLRAFIVDGRLVNIPAKHARRQVVLEHIVARFTPGVRYHERDVNAVLISFHPDHAALRRYLIDHLLLARDPDGTSYWRIG